MRFFDLKKNFLNKNPRKVDFGYGNIGENSEDSRFPYIAPNEGNLVWEVR